MRHVVTSPIALVAASARPSGLNVILLMGAFILAVPITSPFPSSFKNQTAIDPSFEPEASRVPLGAKDRQVIGLSCSSNSPGAVPSGPESLKLRLLLFPIRQLLKGAITVKSKIRWFTRISSHH